MRSRVRSVRVSRRGRVSVAAVVVVALACGVSAAASADSGSSGVLPGYPTDADVISPLVITTIAPDPIPFTGTDQKVHLVYELQVFNASPRPATLTKVETLRGGPTGRVVASISGDAVTERSLLVGPPRAEGVPADTIPGGRVALLLLDDVYDSRAAAPARSTHRVDATFASSPDDDRVTKFYPTAVSQIGGVVTRSARPLPRIGPPLAGTDWVSIGSCCALDGHRGFMLPLGGRMNGTERYALDYFRLDATAEPIVDLAAGYLASYAGDPTQNSSYLAFGQPTLAVANGTVVGVVTDAPDRPPGRLAEGLELQDVTGNYVIIDIGNGVHALSAHLSQGSPTVAVGDRVTKGQVIGRVGNSGNTSQPHLHFQLFRGTAPLSGDNVPFVIDRFAYQGSITRAGVDTTAAGKRSGEYPLTESIVDYPPT